jgi:hypothetical protein
MWAASCQNEWVKRGPETLSLSVMQQLETKYIFYLSILFIVQWRNWKENHVIGFKLQSYFKTDKIEGKKTVLSSNFNHRRMARGGHARPKVSPGPTMPYSSMPWGQATPETALWPFQRWPSRRAGALRPSCTPYDTPRRAPYLNSSNEQAPANHVKSIIQELAEVFYNDFEIVSHR